MKAPTRPPIKKPNQKLPALLFSFVIFFFLFAREHFEDGEDRVYAVAETAQFFKGFAQVAGHIDGSVDHGIEFHEHFTDFTEDLEDLPTDKDKQDGQDGDDGKEQDLGRINHLMVDLILIFDRA